MNARQFEQVLVQRRKAIRRRARPRDTINGSNGPALLLAGWKWKRGA